MRERDSQQVVAGISISCTGFRIPESESIFGGQGIFGTANDFVRYSPFFTQKIAGSREANLANNHCTLCSVAMHANPRCENGSQLCAVFRSEVEKNRQDVTPALS
jgi:hypothetical protein